MDEDSLVSTLFAGRFQIERLLGKGGMGSVYLAYHAVLQRPFALKVVHQSLITDLDIATRFRREARAASRVDHPHLTAVFDFGYTEEGRPYLVMEYVDGVRLDEVIHAEKVFPLPRAMGILLQTAEALAAAHACNVVHRDLKPQNILLTKHREHDDYVKIMDFGLAKILSHETIGLTAEGVTFGTPYYMSPEQCTGAPFDFRSDIYSFGILAFEVLVGTVPFKGPVVQTMNAHLNQKPIAPSNASGRADIPDRLDDLILRCLAKQPEERFADGQALVRELQEIGDNSSSSRALWQVRTEEVAPISNASLELASSWSGSPALKPESALFPDRSEETHLDLVEEATQVEKMNPLAEELGLWHSDTVEELACALRDRGLGTVEISLELADKLVAEERMLSMETRVAMLEESVALTERSARKREVCLRQALCQLEHERAALTPLLRGHDPATTVPWSNDLPAHEVGGLIIKIEERAAEIVNTMQQNVEETESQLQTLQEMLAKLRPDLAERREQVVRHQRRLGELLQEAHLEKIEEKGPE